MEIQIFTSWQKCLHVWIALFIIIPNLSENTWAASSLDPQSHNILGSPEFEDMPLGEINAVVGQTLLLPCTVRNLRDRVVGVSHNVSWIRTKDLHILTSGSVTFSADSRFESVYSTNRDFWGLRLRGARIADTGQYECQVNTDPKMSFAINLTVTESPTPQSTNYLGKILIKGPKEIMILEGTPTVLTCEVFLLAPPVLQSSEYDFFLGKPRVRWFQNEHELSFEKGGGGGISVVTDYTNRKVISRLKIAMVTHRNGGNYTCRYATMAPDSVRLSIREPEHMEAMQGDYPQLSRGMRMHIVLELILLHTLYTVFRHFSNGIIL